MNGYPTAQNQLSQFSRREWKEGGGAEGRPELTEETRLGCAQSERKKDGTRAQCAHSPGQCERGGNFALRALKFLGPGGHFQLVLLLWLLLHPLTHTHTHARTLSLHHTPRLFKQFLDIRRS